VCGFSGSFGLRSMKVHPATEKVRKRASFEVPRGNPGFLPPPIGPGSPSGCRWDPRASLRQGQYSVFLPPIPPSEFWGGGGPGGAGGGARWTLKKGNKVFFAPEPDYIEPGPRQRRCIRFTWVWGRLLWRSVTPGEGVGAPPSMGGTSASLGLAEGQENFKMPKYFFRTRFWGPPRSPQAPRPS